MFNPIFWIIPKNFLIESLMLLFRFSKFFKYFITILQPLFVRRSLPLFIPFMNRWLPDDGWRTQQKHVAVLNEDQYIRSEWAGYLSRYSDWLRTGRSGIESRRGRDFPPVQTGPGAHPACCKMGTVSFPGVKCDQGVLLTTHPLLVPRSWKSKAKPLPTLWATPGL